MHVLIVGSGKLAAELLHQISLPSLFTVCNWSSRPAAEKPAIIIHTGSGRELDEVIAYCQKTNSVLVELSTGSKLAVASPAFPIVLCPNTNILMLKFMRMLANNGNLFKGYPIELTESHQAEKQSTPGTALDIAQSLGLPADALISVRDREKQLTALSIPPEHLERHAFHSIRISDGACQILLETRVYGSTPYANGVSTIISAIATRKLENRLYMIDEFVEQGWI